MATQTGICNLALTWIGIKPISNIEENSEPALRIKDIYNEIRKAVLRDHNWNFATKITPLALLDETIYGWSYVYMYPSDCVFAREIVPAAAGNPVPFRDVLSPNGVKVIVCNMAQAVLEYTADVTDPTLFDASFVEAFALRLASHLAHALTGNAKLAMNLINLYNLSLGKAETNNLSEGYQETNKTCVFIDER